jgi:thiamine-phosphate pyrophosphorylase
LITGPLAQVFNVPRPILMAIVGARSSLAAARAVRGGADLVQVRARDLSSRDLMALVREVIAELGGGERVFVNSRPDIAELAGASGVHLPESGLDPGMVRRAFPGLVIGVSRHDRKGLERAAEEGADFALLGPVFQTPGKESRALGPDRLQEALRGLRLPVIAVGGVVPDNGAALVRAGALGVAAIRPFADPQSAQGAAASFRAALDQTGA